MVNLVQHDDDGTVEKVEFVPKKAVHLCLRVARVADLIRGVTERVDEANRDLITRVQAVAVDLDDGEGDIVVPGGVFLELVQEKSGCGGFSDPAFPVQKDVRRRFSVDYRLECGVVLLEFVVPTDQIVRRVLLQESVTVLVKGIIPVETERSHYTTYSQWSI